VRVARGLEVGLLRRAPSDRALTDAFLIERIKEIHAQARGVYGAPRIHAELVQAHWIGVAKKRVARLMAEAGHLGPGHQAPRGHDDPGSRRQGRR